MVCRLAVAALAALVTLSSTLVAQTQGVLHIRVTLTDTAGVSTPVPRHALLISDNPATSSPRRVVTGPDGRVDVRLRPGNYTIESEEAVAFGGSGYEWVRTLDVVAGGEVTLALTATNAEIAPLSAADAATAASAPPPESSPALLLPQWQDSIVAVWTPTARATGFIVDTSGLVLTNQRAIGSATAVEVQLARDLKVAARVVAADETRDVAVLQLNPEVTASLTPVPMACEEAGAVLLGERRKVIALGSPLRGPKDLSIGEVLPGTPGTVLADIRLERGSLGGPVFGTAGTLVGLSSTVDDQNERRRRDARIVPVRVACEVLETARQAVPAAPPSAARLPVEPAASFPSAALDAAPPGAGNIAPYTMSASDFDVAFITPVVLRNAQRLAASGRTTSQSLQMQANPVDLMDFSEWSDYFADLPAVLVVRVTPRFEEGWWTKVARGAAFTQGVALPPIKRFKPGFTGLRVFCGDTEVTPIHPFTLQQRVSDTDAVREGLFVFEPQALGPHCTAATLRLSSEETPAKQDTRSIDRRILQRIWDDFAPHRALAAGAPVTAR